MRYIQIITRIQQLEAMSNLDSFQKMDLPKLHAESKRISMMFAIRQLELPK
jgi:hypothetical protein